MKSNCFSFHSLNKRYLRLSPERGSKEQAGGKIWARASLVLGLELLSLWLVLCMLKVDCVIFTNVRSLRSILKVILFFLGSRSSRNQNFWPSSEIMRSSEVLRWVPHRTSLISFHLLTSSPSPSHPPQPSSWVGASWHQSCSCHWQTDARWMMAPMQAPWNCSV